jgi:large conductance mechanosensitive channel
MLKEFRDFIMRGNVLDLAVAVVIGAAFGAVITSLVNDIVMPPIGYLLGGVNFADLFIVLGGGEFPSLQAAQDAGAAVIAYGKFIQTLINFLIIAFVIFLIIKSFNKMASLRKKEEATAAPAEPPAEVKLLTEIRDLLKQR